MAIAIKDNVGKRIFYQGYGSAKRGTITGVGKKRQYFQYRKDTKEYSYTVPYVVDVDDGKKDYVHPDWIFSFIEENKMEAQQEIVNVYYEGDFIYKTVDGDATFVKFVVDYLAMEEGGICSICEKEIDHGWRNMDGGEEYCSDCVVVV